jgi:hypothetical protein
MSSTGARAGALAKRLAPYVIAAVALGWVLRHIDRTKMLEALGHAPIAAFLGVSTLMIVLNCAADTFAMTAVFSRFGCRVKYWELYFVRASTYLLAVVNYHVGQAAIIGYLYRARNVPLLRATGWILFIIGINVGTLFLLASAGASNATGQLRLLRLVPIVCAVGVMLYAALLLWKPRFLVERALFAPLFEMGIAGHVFGVLVRLPHVGVLLVWHFVSLRMFGVAVTPGAALLYLPAYFAVTSLPVNVNGIGVAQVVALAFFAPYATVPPGTVDPLSAQKAAVAAYSLATSGISIVLQVALGLLCLRKGAALGARPASEAPSEDERVAGTAPG